MAKRTITLELLAKNKTSKGFKDAGRDAQAMSRVMAGAGAAAAAGIAVAAGAAVAFGISSVKAFAEAEEAQNRLAFAFEKFPALADTSIQALQGLNEALMKKTRFDDDAIASGQAVLAQFGLTGDQLKRLTPLLLDYSTRTGKDLTTSAEDLGRALLGQGRALKVVGVDLEDTGTLAGNFDQLIQGLEGSVGGLAETAAETAAGKLEQLQNRFGEVQETIGAALMPALDSLLEWLEGDGLVAVETFANWLADEAIPAVKGFADEVGRMAEDGTLVPTVVAGIAAITLAMAGLNAVMLLNPVGLVVLALAGLVAQIAWVITEFDTFKLSMENTDWAIPIFMMISGLVGAIAFFAANWDAIWFGITSTFSVYINYLITLINFLLFPLQSVLDVINAIAGTKLSVRIGYLDLPQLSSGRSTQTSVNTSQMGGMVGLAAGGIVSARPGGIPAVIGEGAYDEAVIPLSARNLSMMGGGSVSVTINGFVGTSKDQVAQAIVRVIEDAKRSGAVRAGALA